MAQLKPQKIVIVGAGLAVRHQPKLIELLGRQNIYYGLSLALALSQ
jgi:hypothetical protein